MVTNVDRVGCDLSNPFVVPVIAPQPNVRVPVISTAWRVACPARSSFVNVAILRHDVTGVNPVFPIIG